MIPNSDVFPAGVWVVVVCGQPMCGESSTVSQFGESLGICWQRTCTIAAIVRSFCDLVTLTNVHIHQLPLNFQSEAVMFPSLECILVASTKYFEHPLKCKLQTTPTSLQLHGHAESCYRSKKGPPSCNTGYRAGHL